MIAGFEEPDTGNVELAGEDVTGVPPYDRAVNTVFQDYALFPHMTVGENVEYGLRVKGVGKEERRRRASEALATVRLPGYEDRKPNQLSGDSSSGSRWRGRSSTNPGCCCSMSPSGPST